MKINSTLFTVVVIVIVAAISYYIGVSNRRVNPDQQSTTSNILPMVSKQIEVIETDPESGKQEIEKNYVDKSLEFQKQGTNSERRLTFPPNLITPYSIVDNQLTELNRTTQQVEYGLKRTSMPRQQLVGEILQLRDQYIASKNKILGTKKNMELVKNLVAQGSISQEAGKEAMWRLVLPEETQRAMFQRPKQPEIERPTSTRSHGIVTGILYSEGSPLAIIDGKVLGEEQSIHGVKILKIHPDYVEFENAGSRWSQRINEPSLPHWP